MDHSWILGEIIEFEVESSLFEGVYVSKILGMNTIKGILQIDFPHANGKLVLLPVGSLVHVRSQLREHSQLYSVIDRVSGSNRCLVLQLVNTNSNRIQNFSSDRPVELYTVCSGKGGVGKTTFAINLAVSLHKLGKRVCILDAALGTANVDVLLDITPRYNLVQLLLGECTMLELLTETPEGIYLIPGCSGVQQITEMTTYQFNYLADQLNSITEHFDVIIIDTGAGVSRNVTNFVLGAQQGCLVTTPEPHSITDSYALLKTLAREQVRPLKLGLVVNRVRSKAEAEDTADKLVFSAKKFLDFELCYLGYIPNDYQVEAAISQQKSVVGFDPTSVSAFAFKHIADQLGNKQVLNDQSGIRADYIDPGNVTKIITKLKNIGKRA